MNGRVAIVTGAGRGFGKAIAERFAAEGAAVALLSRTRAQLDEVAAEIQNAGGQALVVTADVTSPNDVRAALAQTTKRFGAVTDIVSNAGVAGPFGPIWQDPEQWWAAQKVHQLAPLLLLREVMPGMIERGAGRIILVSARASHMQIPHFSAYCVGKLAQTRIAKHVALEVQQQNVNVRIFAIDPGFVFTDMAEAQMNSPEAQRWMPDMVRRLREKKDSQDRDSELPLCAQRCVDLASGRYDALSGGYFELTDDLDAVLAERSEKFKSPNA